MSVSAIRAHIKSALDGVTDVGITHDYERWSAEYADTLTFFETTIGGTKQLRGWEIVYGGFDAVPPEQPISMGRTKHHRAHRWQVRGYLGVDDSAATQKTGDTLAESVCNAFDSDSSLHGSYYRTTEAQIDLAESRVHADILFHYYQISLMVVESVTN